MWKLIKLCFIYLFICKIKDIAIVYAQNCGTPPRYSLATVQEEVFRSGGQLPVGLLTSPTPGEALGKERGAGKKQSIPR